eukprot:jgi/Pico_ML_1/52515/g387.t1
MVEGTVSAWKKQEGDAVNTGDVLADIETDKATMEMETMEDGFLAKILAPAGTANVPVGTPVAILVTSEEDIAAFKDYEAEEAEAAKKPEPAVAEGSTVPSAAPVEPGSGADGPRVYISDPSVLRGPPGWVPGRRAVQ